MRLRLYLPSFFLFNSKSSFNSGRRRTWTAPEEVNRALKCISIFIGSRGGVRFKTWILMRNFLHYTKVYTRSNVRGKRFYVESPEKDNPQEILLYQKKFKFAKMHWQFGNGKLNKVQLYLLSCLSKFEQGRRSLSSTVALPRALGITLFTSSSTHFSPGLQGNDTSTWLPFAKAPCIYDHHILLEVKLV